ncbi:hypothetical protein ABK040_014189 [Willaertia magna]
MLQSFNNDLRKVSGEEEKEEEEEILNKLRSLPYIIHGSKDSLDKDIIYFLTYPNNLPSPSICFKFCRENKEIENRNLIVVNNNIIINCFKGTSDAINNQILMTYDYHLQEFKCPIKEFVQRNIVLKMCRGIRQILSMVGRVCHLQKIFVKNLNILLELSNCDNIENRMEDDLTELYHSELKFSMKSLDFNLRLKCLQKLDFVKICKVCLQLENQRNLFDEIIINYLNNDNFKKNILKFKRKNNYIPDFLNNYLKDLNIEPNLTIDKKTAGEEGDFLHIIKSITFQMVQTIAQLEDIELYSKKGIVERDERTYPLMYRQMNEMLENNCLNILNEYRDLIIERMNCFLIIKKKNKFNNFYLNLEELKEKNLIIPSYFHQQCNGMIIQMGSERVVCNAMYFLIDKLNKNSLWLQYYLENKKEIVLEIATINLLELKDIYINYFKFRDNLYSIYCYEDKIYCNNYLDKVEQQLINLFKNVNNYKDYTFHFLKLDNQFILISICDLINFKYFSFTELQNYFNNEILNNVLNENISCICQYIDVKIVNSLFQVFNDNLELIDKDKIVWVNGLHFGKQNYGN